MLTSGALPEDTTASEVSVAAVSHIGRICERNEDRAVLGSYIQGPHHGQIHHARLGNGQVIAVIDSMDGHLVGELAAQLAAEVCSSTPPIASLGPGRAVTLVEDVHPRTDVTHHRRGRETDPFNGRGEWHPLRDDWGLCSQTPCCGHLTFERDVQTREVVQRSRKGSGGASGLMQASPRTVDGSSAVHGQPARREHQASGQSAEAFEVGRRPRRTAS